MMICWPLNKRQTPEFPCQPVFISFATMACFAKQLDVAKPMFTEVKADSRIASESVMPVTATVNAVEFQVEL